MKKLLLTSCLCFLAVPAFGQGSSITVIHDDGSKDVVDLTKKAPAQKPASEPDLRELVKKTLEVPEVEVPEAVAVPPARRAIAKPAEKAKKIKKAAPEKSVKTAAHKPKEQEAAEGRWPPIPARKPYVSAAIAPKAAAAARGFITKDEALHIALNIAPPAKDFSVHDDDAGYAVVFRTGARDYQVLVDKNSGDVISEGYLEGRGGVTLPGHLPSR